MFPLLCVSASTLLAGESKPGYTELTLPVLTVAQDATGHYSGRLLNLELSVSHKTDNRPLLVAVAEDRPSGVGEQFRAAMWSAASTVALERGSTLRGYKLEVTAEEAIDGPSVGAMMTFAIMNTLDGNRMPTDFAFTGSILPNGSVGYVGGLVQKIEAAKAAGKKRVFVPAYYRAEQDLNTGEMVDLKRKCTELGLEFIPVANIREAYALINNIKSATPPTPVLELPGKVESVYGAIYREQLKTADAVFSSLSAEQRSTITNSMLKELILDTREKADTHFRAGNLPAACDAAVGCSTMVQAFAKAHQVYSRIEANQKRV